MRLLTSVLLACAAVGSAWAVRAPQRAAASDVMPALRSGGLRPPTTDFTHLRSALLSKSAPRRGAKLLKAESPIPSRWDSREHGWVTSIKSQGSYGTCWAFSTMASLETAFLVATQGAVTNDFSENHLATHDVGFDFGFASGGNNQVAAALLTSWRDPLLESEDPYPNPNSRTNAPPHCHVQDIVWLPERYCPEFAGGGYAVDAAADNQAVDAAYKRAIMKYGAVGIGYFHSWNGYNAATAAHCYSNAAYVDSGRDGGHAVTLIGWDDDYPVENFVAGKHPKGKGAFLVKNSWGNSSDTTNGCSWISYYDELVSYMPGAAYPVPEKPDNYGRIYEYDPCGQVATWNVCDTDAEQAAGNVTNWCANVFTATASGLIEAVGFYAMSADTAYRLRVYRGCMSSPSDGELMVEQAGAVSEAGFTTVRLEGPVPIGMSATKFSVVLQLTCPGYDYPLPVECTLVDSEGPWCTCTANAGESYMSKDGTVWRDFHDYDPSGNFCIKAYTRHGSDGEVLPLIMASSPAEKSLSGRVGGSQRFSVTAKAAAEGEEISYEWRVNGVPVDSSGAEFDFVPAFVQRGNCVVECVVQSGVSADVCKWTVAVNAELHVACGGGSANPDGSVERPFASVSDACVAAIEGDTVLVGPGVYRGTLEGPSVRIEIRSTDGPDATVLDAEWNGRCFQASQNPDVCLSGFTLCNADALGYLGGGALSGVITNCVITNCVASVGGGAYDATLYDCRIVGCSADYYGGGICDAVASGCLLVGNSAYWGGAAGSYQYGCELYGCTVVRNMADSGGGIDSYCYGVDSILWDNVNAYGNLSNWGRARRSASELYYCCTCPSGHTGGRGCVYADPLFAAAARCDMRLMAGSPCLGTASDGRNMGWYQGEIPTNSVWTVGGEDGFATVQDALDVALRGDEVLVAPGVYPGVVNLVEDVLIESTEGASQTVLDGAGSDRCFDDYGFASLNGFTLRNGVSETDVGGGACYGLLMDCVISNCTALAGGGAAWSELDNCLIVRNRAEAAGDSAGWGGGVYNCQLFNCTVAGNSAANLGGGAYLDSGCAAVNTIVATNVCDQGFANGNDIYGMGYYETVCSISDQDAKFVDAANGDWRLSARSPCIDAGSNAFVYVERDLDGTNRIVGARVDLGCYEYCRTVPGWATPAVAQDATAAEEASAVAAAMTATGFSPAKANVFSTVAQYAAFSDWAAGHGLQVGDVNASPTAFVSAALDASELLKLSGEDVQVSGFAPTGDGTSWKVKVALEAYDPARVNPALLKAAVGIVGAETPSGDYSAAGLNFVVTPAADGIDVNVTPPAGKNTYFMRSVVR